MSVAIQESGAKSSFCFEEVKKFAGFLLNEKIEEATREYIQMLRKHQLPLLKFFSSLSEQELSQLCQKSLEEFFGDIEQDVALEKALHSLTLWKANELPGIPRDGVEGADLVLIYSIRKQLFLAFLPEYSNDCQQIVKVVQELEQFHVTLEHQAFATFVEIQQEELSKKNEFLSSLVHYSDEAIMVFDTEHRLLEWNPAAEALFGTTRSEVLDKKVTDLFPHLIKTDFFLGLQRSLKGERVQIQHQRFIKRSGWYDASIAPLFNSSGTITGALSVLHDVTGTVEQEEKLKEHQEELQASNEELQESLTQLEETEEVLRTTVEQLEEAQAISHLGHWEYDISRNLIFWSRELRNIYGIAQQELDLSYQTYLDFVHPDDRALVSGTIARCFEDKQPYTFEHRIIRKSDGETRWLLARGLAVVAANNQLLKLRGVAMDITERKEAELLVQEEQHFIQQITNTSPDIITVFDLEKRVNMYGNRELYEILGYTPEEAEKLRKEKGSQWTYSLVHPEDLAPAIAFIEEFRTYTGTGVRETEYRIKIKSGEYIWVCARYSVFKRNSSGYPIQIIGITRNITHQKETEQLLLNKEARLREVNSHLEEQVNARTAELTRKNHQLVRINADLDNFIYTASHDLKAPIANLEGLLTLLDSKIKSLLSEREQELLNMMHKSVSRFKITIKDLTDIAVMQKELEEESSEAVELQPLIQDVKEDLNGQFIEAGTQLHLDLAVEEVAYNRKNLRSILHNLISNAIKYRSADRAPEISIKTSRLDDYVLLQVRDNGQGIPEKQYEKVFSLFKRLHKDVEGSGMGLYIVKRIIENSGGRIEVSSEVGEGSCFNLYLKEQAVYEK